MKLFLGVFQYSTGIFFKSQTFYLKLLDIVCHDFISKSKYNVEWQTYNNYDKKGQIFGRNMFQGLAKGTLCKNKPDLREKLALIIWYNFSQKVCTILKQLSENINIIRNKLLNNSYFMVLCGSISEKVPVLFDVNFKKSMWYLFLTL